MKIETVALEDHQTKLIAELDSETLERYMQRAARKISRESRIPGFRPGKAPYDVVRRIHGDQMLQQEAIELMLDDIYPAILNEAKIQPSGPGKLDEIISVNPPKFSFVVPLPPVVELGDYKSIRKDYAPEPITEEQVEQSLKSLQRSYATAEPVERPAEKGDLVSIKLSANRLNLAEGEETVLIPEGSYQMVVGEPDAADEEWPYPGFTEELAGLSTTQNKTWMYTFSQDTKFEDLRGKEAEFTVEAQSVKSLQLPDLTDEFAQTLGEFKTIEELRTAVRMQLEQNYQQQYDQSYMEDLINQVVAISSVKYPPHLVDEEVEQFIHGVEHDLEHDRLDLETYLKMRQIDRETFVAEEVLPAATRRLERSLVLEEFARHENIEVKSDEVRSIYYAALQQMQQSSELKKLQSQNKQSARDMANSIAVNTVNNIFNQRLITRLKAIAAGKADEEVAPVEELVAEETAAVEETVAIEEQAAPEAAIAENTTAPVETETEDQPGAASSEADEAAA